MTPLELLRCARDWVAWGDPATRGLWSRAAALLGRQALEGAMNLLWAERAPGVAECSARAQLLCLGEYLGDADLARDVSHAWWALSRATHQHFYDLAPTATELRIWLDVVARLIAQVEESSKPEAVAAGR